MDIDKHVAYWRVGASKAFRSVRDLCDRGFVSEALFWTHLAVEKALKAHVTKVMKTVRTHNLVRLATLAGVPLDDAQKILASASPGSKESAATRRLRKNRSRTWRPRGL